jgi:hypothetical protein
MFIHSIGFRTLCIVLGLAFLGMGTCGAFSKASAEGWEGPSSKPGAAKKR